MTDANGKKWLNWAPNTCLLRIGPVAAFRLPNFGDFNAGDDDVIAVSIDALTMGVAARLTRRGR